MIPMQTAFTSKKDFGKDDRQAQWAHQQRTLHGLTTVDAKKEIEDVPELALEAKRRAEMARYNTTRHELSQIKFCSPLRPSSDLTFLFCETG